MSDLERDAFKKLRQRWAKENFGTSLSSTSQSHLRLDEEAGPSGGLSNVFAVKPEPARTRSSRSSRAKRSSRSSWGTSLCGKGDGGFSDGQTVSSLRLPSTRSIPGRSPYDTALPATVTSRDHSTKYLGWAHETLIISWLVFCSILGTLARLGIEALTQYPSAPVTTRVLWANLGGSFLMGFLIEDRKMLQQPSPSTGVKRSLQHNEASRRAEYIRFKQTVPLYIGLTTGFCGSLTSFSSYMRDAFLALTNALETPSTTIPYRSVAEVYPRSGGFSFLAVLAILIIHPAVSHAGYKAGAHLSMLTAPIVPGINTVLLNRFLNPSIVILAFGSWLGLSLALIFCPPYPLPIDIFNWRARALMPMLLAPPGCLLRYYLSRYGNSIISAFPLGTFISNALATAILGMAWDLQHARTITSSNACAVLEGIIEGFCGCLGTVSTWIVELDTLERKRAWVYGLASVSGGLGLLTCIMGGMGWSVGFEDVRCG